jgi:hypothetical protein
LNAGTSAMQHHTKLLSLNRMKHLQTLVIVILFLCFHAGHSQQAIKPRPSPLAIASIKYKDAYIKITYSQPHKNNRNIFGSLVPYAQVWRTGANEATELTLTKDILLNNLLLKAGTYSLFTIPDKEKWTVIINSENGLWGAYNYNAKLDVMRFEAVVQNNIETYEPFTIAFDQKNDLAELLLMWDKIKISIPVKFIN